MHMNHAPGAGAFVKRPRFQFTLRDGVHGAPTALEPGREYELSAVVVEGWADHLQQLREGGAAAVNLRHRRWSKALVDSVHEADLLAFGWDAQSTRRIRGLLALGCDAVYSDHVDRMVRVLSGHRGPAG